MRKTTYIAAFSAMIFSLAFSGCEKDEELVASSGKTDTQETTQAVQGSASQNTEQNKTDNGKTTPENKPSEPSQPTTGGAADAVPFGALNFCYGGFKGSGAVKTSASIGGLRMSKESLSYRWTGNTLQSWGLSDGDTSPVACLFVQKADGSWVGGKFDFISTSRTSRSMENIRCGYHGWSLGGCNATCKVAFVIISGNGKKRTNVITSSWTH